jgi:hypothetical protein
MFDPNKVAISADLLNSPNTIVIQCDEIILTKGCIKLEIDCRLDPPLEQCAYIEINGVKFKKEA